VDLLNRVGFRAQSILALDIENNDVEALKWARRNRCILVCHDQHKDTQTRYAFHEEMYRRGGKVIRIGGEPGQDPLFALGKILAQRPAWQRHFEEHPSGQAIVHMGGCKFSTAALLFERASYRYQLPFGDDPAMSLKERKPLPAKPRQPRKQPPEARRLPTM
jgi:hypothetical protein